MPVCGALLSKAEYAQPCSHVGGEQPGLCSFSLLRAQKHRQAPSSATAHCLCVCLVLCAFLFGRFFATSISITRAILKIILG